MTTPPFVDPPGFNDALLAAADAVCEPYAKMGDQTRAEFLAEFPHLTVARALNAAMPILGPTAAQALQNFEQFTWDTADPVWLDGWNTAVQALATYVRTHAVLLEPEPSDPADVGIPAVLAPPQPPPRCCAEDSQLGPHYHCARCAKVCSMAGHTTEQQCENAR